ncbi:SDR family NAD(P)-dependent oxidoreductase [Oceanibacterium hippocampi]|uniref:2-(S)-hydroxypropyl-CoM dehydrogenase n=1 Tax=Oceanibacterium hippocampi TaxID=745714 RepID=A0A1Y5TX16_9PROT|nr:SDR family oxidoreductase [Oceanibacterium hippocampi]SLN72101.1 2-(S)-hydroxypropyl-CoM dehydrogenase [Oceanibacterium hippocampi]
MNIATNNGLAVILGGGNGIGEATARLMQARGWQTAIADKDAEAADRVATDLGATGFEVDISSEASVAALASQVETTLGPVSALVVAAAVFQDIVPTEDLETEVWERILHTNLTGSFLANRIFGKAMLARRRGSIVNIASIAALGSMPAEAYGTSKAAVVHMTQNFAGEWGRSGIRVNAVSPGSTLVSRVARRLQTGRYASDPGDFTALGRIVQPNEVAEAIEFLASERASAITGVNLVVDAGWQVASTWSQFGGVRPAREPE